VIRRLLAVLGWWRQEHELGRVNWPTREQRPPLREGGGDWLAMAKWLKEQR
jgi:hypothetical protein